MSHAVIGGIKNEEEGDSLSEIVDLLGLTREELENPANSKEIVDLLRRLEAEEEEVVQNGLADKWMNENYPNCFGMNTHALDCNFPVFQFARSPTGSERPVTRPAHVSGVKESKGQPDKRNG
jgi:hypothetical protein